MVGMGAAGRITCWQDMHLGWAMTVALLLFFVAPSWAAGLANAFPGSARGYLVKIGNTTTWGEGTQRRLPPASLTKMMTALLVLERGRLDDVATVSQAAARETGSRLDLRAGQRFTVRSMLAAAMIRSANDACHVLADYVGGNEARFVRLMNAKAAALGMRNTHFTNACGHHHVQHYSSAADLAILAERLLRFPVVVQLAQRSLYTIRTRDGAKTYTFKSTNKLLGQYPGAMGLKTGYTPQAGRCLVATAYRNGTRVLLVLLHAPQRWETASTMLDHAFVRVRTATSRPLSFGPS